jgi:hypothetical protein
VQFLGGPPRAPAAVLSQVFNDQAHIFEVRWNMGVELAFLRATAWARAFRRIFKISVIPADALRRKEWKTMRRTQRCPQCGGLCSLEEVQGL